MYTSPTSDEVIPLRKPGKPDKLYGSNTDMELGKKSNVVGEIDAHKGTIGMFGSIAIMVNSLTGPAMLNLPSTFQRSGIIPTTLTIILLCILSSLCSLHMADVISKVPGNKKFQKEIEYSEVFRRFWSHRAYIFTQVAFFCCILCLNVASIMDTAQVVDQIFAHTNKGTAALRYNINNSSKVELVYWSHHSCTKEQKVENDCLPFHEEGSPGIFWLTAGYFTTCLIFLPMSLMDLKENAFFQNVGFIVLIILTIGFLRVFLSNGLSLSNVTLWGGNWGDLFGVVLFNFAVVIAIPTWLYEKKESVNVGSVVNLSSIIGVVLYVIVGGMGALVMPDVSENMLQSMISGNFGTTAEVCAETFAFFIIGLGIPLFSVLSRMNLTGSGLCSKFVANLLAVYLPWILGWLFYIGGSTSSLLGWGGIFFSSIIVFLAPLLLAIHERMKFNEEGVVSMYWGLFQSKRAQLIVLFILLFFAVVSVTLAVIGELY